MADPRAQFHETYRLYGPALYRFCLVQKKNPADAEDVLQEVFVKRLTRAPAFPAAEDERRWLFRVAANQCRDEWRRSRRRDLPLESADFPALAAEELGVLEQVAALPPPQRIVLHLHYCEGYSVAEIARLLGVSASAVKMRMKRGRDALRENLEGSLGPMNLTRVRIRRCRREAALLLFVCNHRKSHLFEIIAAL